MKEYHLYWRDLTPEAQERMRLIPRDKTGFEPIASFEVEDADIGDLRDESQTVEIKLFYRDGGNYKYHEFFTVNREKLEATRAKYGKDFFDNEGDAMIQYDYDLGISRTHFHEQIGSSYNRSYDHNFVIIEEVDGKTNTDPEAELDPDPNYFYSNSSCPAVPLPILPPQYKPKP